MSSEEETLSLSSSESVEEKGMVEQRSSVCSSSCMLWLTIMFSGISGLLWGYDIGVFRFPSFTRQRGNDRSVGIS